MKRIPTDRLDKARAAGLELLSTRAGIPTEETVRTQLDRVRNEHKSQRFMRLVGSVKGARDLSARKGFSKT